MAPRTQFAALSCLLSLSDGVRVKREGTVKVAGVTMQNHRSDADEFMVVFREGTDEATIASACKGRCKLVGSPSKGGLAFASMSSWKNMEAVVSEFPEIVDILQPDEEDYLIPDLEVGPISDMSFGIQSTSWGLDRVGVSQASSTGKGVHVYVQDTGIRNSHSDFGGRVVPAIDLTSYSLVECDGKSTCAVDRQGHGTHCAGTVGGKTFGVARDATLHAVKTLSDRGSGARSWQISAIDWITANGERPAVISMSLGGSGRDESYTRVIGAAASAGITVVVAAGNSNSDSCSFSPAFAADAITVGATTSTNSRASYSNYGTCNQIMAPGSAITSASSGSDTGSRSLSGTSMACPHVSGAAALLLETNPNLSSTQILASFQASGKKGVISGLKSGDPDLFLWVGN